MHSADNPFPAEGDALESEDPPPVEGTLVVDGVVEDGAIVDGATRSVDWSVREGTRMDVSTKASTVWQLDP